MQGIKYQSPDTIQNLKTEKNSPIVTCKEMIFGFLRIVKSGWQFYKIPNAK